MNDRLPEHLLAHVVPQEKQENSGDKPKFKFIVGIKSRQKTSKIVNEWEDLLWIQGQTIHVDVILSNPLLFPINIESISLTTNGCLFEAHSHSLYIPPATKSITISLSGKPLQPGKLFIHGCLIKAFNILSCHPVNLEGQGISM